MFDPLLAKHDDDARADEKQDQDEGTPPEQGRQPCAPGNRLAGLESLVEYPRRRPVAEDQPFGQIGKEDGLPAVFRRGEVERRGDHDEQVFRHGLVGHRGGDPSHGENHDQFVERERRCRTDPRNQGIGQQHAEEEGNEEHRGQVGRRRLVTDLVGGVFSRKADEYRKRGSDEDRPEGSDALEEGRCDRYHLAVAGTGSVRTVKWERSGMDGQLQAVRSIRSAP